MKQYELYYNGVKQKGDGMNKLVNSNTVMDRLGGISRTTLWRYFNDPEFGFPKPVVMRNRNYWKEAELSAWIDNQGMA